jgi:transposase
LQDRASWHTAQDTKLWLAKERVETVYNPTKSPDLSPIENEWAWMAHEVYADKPISLPMKTSKCWKLQFEVPGGRCHKITSIDLLILCHLG